MDDNPIASNISNVKSTRENVSNGISPFEKLSDIQHQLSHLNLLFNVIVDRIQSTYHHKSGDVSLMQLNCVDKNILSNSLPEIEDFFLEKIRLCWFNFKTRFQFHMESENSISKSFFLMTIVNVERELLSFDSMFNNVDNSSSTLNNTVKLPKEKCKKDVQFQLNNTVKLNEPKILYNRINLLQKIYDFDTKRYQDEVVLLKNIPIDCCQLIAERQLRLAPSGHNIILSEGFNIGKIELAINFNGHSFAVKKLSKKSKATVQLASNLTKLMENLLELDNDNILPYTHCVEYPEELWLATPVCDYNLETYIDLMCKKPNSYNLNLQNTVKQMINGLLYLHNTNNGIIHGNMKPSNILIDAVGNIRLADFGITDILYVVIKPRLADIIWWSRETMLNYEINPKKLVCNQKTDIQSLGMIIHFTLTRGVHPFGNEYQEICDNKKNGHTLIRLKNSEHRRMVKNCLRRHASKRPYITAINRYVFLWSDQKKWDFLMTCVEVQYIADSFHVNSFPKCLDAIATDNWDNYLISMSLKTSEENNRFVNCCMPSRFLHYIFSDTILTMKSTCPDMEQLTISYLSSFPTLVFTMVNLVRRTKWAKLQCFQQFFNSVN